MQRHFKIALAITLSTTPAAVAAQAPIALPAPVKAWVDDMARQCRADGGKPSATVAFDEAQFNGDAIADYLVRHETFSCSSWGPSFFCGSAGCSASVILSGPKGHRNAWGGSFQEIAVDRSVTPNRLKAVMHGTTVGANSSNATFTWNERSGKFEPVARR